MVTNRNLGVITDNFSRVLVNYYFWQGYSRENEKRIKLSKRLRNLAVTKYAPEDSRRHGTEAEDRQLPGGAGRPHPSAASPPTEGFLYALLKTYSTTS
jgi:hypothetical protein